jgi:hypothetical protein
MVLMNKTISLFISFLLFQTVLSQTTLVRTFINYSGGIDKYKVAMQLVKTSGSDSISGSYYYLKSGMDHEISLRGMMLGGEVKLEECVYNQKTDKIEKTGVFLLKLDAKGNLNGSWENGKGRTMTAALVRTEKVTPVESYGFALNLFEADCEGNLDNDKICYKATQLKIYNGKKTMVQTVDGFEEAISNQPVGYVEQVDLNFDGFLDFRIPIWFPAAIRYDGSYLYFLYDTKSSRFIRSSQLDQLGILFIDSKNRELYDVSGDGSGDETRTFYKWSGNDLHAVRTETIPGN